MQLLFRPSRLLIMSCDYTKSILRKTIAITVGLIFSFAVFGLLDNVNVVGNFYPAHQHYAESDLASEAEAMKRLKKKVSAVEKYIGQKGFDDQYCFLIDMRLPSGKNRFFVYNLLEDSLAMSGLVTHGKGSEKGSDDLVFSNKPNSKCTSLGKYKMGKAYNGLFGRSYKLHGLDNSNSKAYERSVVLHYFNGVPDTEVYPNQICVSEGCPTVSPEFFVQLKKIMDETKKPVLLWIYY